MITGQWSHTKPCKVFIDGIPLRLGPSLQYTRETTFGFRWGIPCGGATQLAFALLLHCCGAEDAMKYYQMFESDVTSALPLGEGKIFTLWERDIRNFVARKKAIRKSKLGKLYWKVFGKLHFSEDFYNYYVKPNISYEDWWALRPSIYFGLRKQLPLVIN